MSNELIGYEPTSGAAEWLALDDFRGQLLPGRIRRVVMVIGGIPLFVLIVLAVWNLPVWDEGSDKPESGYSANLVGGTGWDRP